MKGSLAVIGCGNWGRNLVRNFCGLLGQERVVCCDQRPEVVQSLATEYPGVSTITNAGPLWQDPSVTAVAIATPVSTHYTLSKKALLAGKHALVEKPLATKTAQAAELCALAESANKVLMVDHLLLFHPAVQELNRRVRTGELGTIYHLYGRRTSLGIVRSEENVLWSLGPHDISVMIPLVGKSPSKVSAFGGTYLQPHLGIQDVVFVTITFPGGQIAQLHLSWQDPRKTREITVVGSRRIAVFDDVQPVEKLRIHDFGVRCAQDDGTLPVYCGDVAVPPLPTAEPLSLVCQHFLTSVEHNRVTISDGRAGLAVVQILEAAQLSLEQEGAPVGLPRESIGG